MGKVKKEVKKENEPGHFGGPESASSKMLKQHNSEILNYDTKNHILLGEHGIKNVQAMNCMGTFPGQTEPFSVEQFKKQVKIKIISCSKGDAFNTDKIKSDEDKELLPNESRKDMDIESVGNEKYRLVCRTLEKGLGK